MAKNCLNCKFEPDWGEKQGREYAQEYGSCKFEPNIPPLPPTIIVSKAQNIVRYSDDSGIFSNCRVWEPKDETVDNSDNSNN